MRGFTLIETIIYIVLLGILMTGALLAGYSLILNSNKDSARTNVQDEGNFVQRKLAYAMEGMTTAPTITANGCDGSVSFTRTGGTSPIEFRRNTTSKVIEMREGGTGSFIPLTTSAVQASCFSVMKINAVGTGPSGFEATTTLSSAGNGNRSFLFPITRYVRQ